MPITAPLLCLDIGSGTQDVLYVPRQVLAGDWPWENCPKFVLPAPAQRVAGRIRQATAAGRGVHLHGEIMGGGFFRALKAHVAAGLPASCTARAALSLFDDAARVTSLGVALAESPPAGSLPIRCEDFSWSWWEGFLAMAGLEPPALVLAAAQDHGHHPEGDNRRGRFRLWERFLLEAQGRPESLLHAAPPASQTRLLSLLQAMGGGFVADTGAAAVLGALFEAEIDAACRRTGILVLNYGNSHVIAFRVFAGRMWGVYEHHTGLRNEDELLSDLEAFRLGTLAGEAVHETGGHGCLCLPAPAEAGAFSRCLVLGPQRHRLAGRRLADGALEFPCPGGDMMLAGCFGLVHGLRLRGDAG